MAKLFTPGAQFPPNGHIERLAMYARGRTIFDGNHAEIYERASELLKNTPQAAQLRNLYIAVNLIDILVTKPADLMVGEPPTYESGHPDDAMEQQRLNSIVEENDLNTLIHEVVTGAGIRGEAFIKTYYATRQDVSETEAYTLEAPATNPEPIIEAVDASIVFPELSRGSRKRFKAVNIAWIEWELTDKVAGLERYLTRKDDRYTEIPYLNVERHVPGYIVYERYRLSENGVDTTYGVPISLYTVEEEVSTGRKVNVIDTGVPELLVQHVPYKTVDDGWRGIGGIEKLESVLAAINDRLVQIDYILYKHSDPTAFGPELPVDEDGGVRWSGKYIPVSKDEATPGYMVWESQLEGAFKQLDVLLGIVYQMSETPQWLFGTTLASDKGGTGTSHTDAGSIKARFMPILSKVKRIRNHVDRSVRDALWIAMKLENYANEGVEGFEPYTPIYPKINWRDGIPRDEKAEAETFAIRTGNHATLDVKSALKRMDGLNDEQADLIIDAIKEDDKRVNGVVDGTVFNS